MRRVFSRRALGVSGVAGGSITLWDLQTGLERLAFEGHTSTVQVVAFSPDGRTVISGSAYGTVRTWDVTTGKLVRTLPLCKPGSGNPCNFDICLAKGRIASCDLEGVKLWDLNSGSLIRKIASPAKRVRVAPDGSSLVAMDPELSPEIWDLTKESAAAC